MSIPTSQLHRLPKNASGPYYVTDECIDCTACYENFPAIYRLDEATRYSFVHHQPTTPEELGMAQEGLEGCPVDAIQRDGGF